MSLTYANLQKMNNSLCYPIAKLQKFPIRQMTSACFLMK